MKKIEYIRESHKQANHKIKISLDGVYRRIHSINPILGWIWWLLAWIIFGIVNVVSWLAFVVTLFKNVKFTLHYLECVITKEKMDNMQVHHYLSEQMMIYKKYLSYGSIPVKEEKRIDQTFEYLQNKYLLPVVESVNEDNSKDTEIIKNLSEIKNDTSFISNYTSEKIKEAKIQKEYETTQIAEAEERREKRKNRNVPILEDLCSTLNEEQHTILTQYINEIDVFNLRITEEDLSLLLFCQHEKPFQTTHNKVLALLLELLSKNKFITKKWQRVADKKNCFTSKQGKHLTAKDLSSAKQEAGLLEPEIIDKINDCIEELKTV